MTPLEYLAACVLSRELPDFAWVVEHAPDGTLDGLWSDPGEPLADKLFLLQVLGRPRPAWAPRRGPLAAVVKALVRHDAARVGPAIERAACLYFERLVRAPDYFWESLAEEVEKEFCALAATDPATLLEIVRLAALTARGSPRWIDSFVQMLHGTPEELLAVLLAHAPAPTYAEVLAEIGGTT